MNINGTFDVHRNLAIGGWTVLQGQLKVAHRHFVIMHLVKWIVQPAGSIRAKEEQRRNVHAYARGHIVAAFSGVLPNEFSTIGLDEITYNPFEHDSFVWRSADPSIDNTPVHSTPWAVFTKLDGADKVFAHREH